MKHICLTLLVLLCATVAQALEIPATDAEREGAPMALLEKGYVLLIEKGDIAGAEAAFREALAEAPDNVLVRAAMASVLADQSKFRDAIEQATVMIEKGAWGPVLQRYLEGTVYLAHKGESLQPLRDAMTTRLAREDLAWTERAMLRQALTTLQTDTLERLRNPAATAPVMKEPFIRHWLVLGPFANRDRSGFLSTQTVEDWAKLDLAQEHEGRGRPVGWVLAESKWDGVLDLDSTVYPGKESSAYAVVLVEAQEETEATLALGGGGASQLWVNGSEIYRDGSYERVGGTLKRLVPTTLRKGWNLIAFKCAGDAKTPMVLAARILPLSPEALQEAGAAAKVDELAKGLRLSTSKEDLAAYLADTPEASPAPKDTAAVRGNTGMDWGALAFYSKQAEAADAVETNPMAVYGKAYLYITTGLDNDMHDRSRPLLEQVAKAYPKWVSAQVAASIVQTDENLKRDLLTTAADIPDAFDAQDRLISHLFFSGFVREAEQKAKVLLEKAPESDASIILYAVDQKRGWDAESRVWAERLAKTHPLYDKSYEALYDTALGDKEKKAVAQEALDTVGSMGDRLAATERKQGNTQLAREIYTGLVARNPYDLGLWKSVASCHVAENDFDGAITTLQEARAWLPQTPELTEEIGRLQLRAGQKEAALASFRAALAVKADNPELQSYIEQLVPKQKAFYEVVQIDYDDLEGKDATPADYPDFNAVGLLDQGYVYANKNGTQQQMIRSVVKVLRQGAVQQNSYVSVGYDPARERVELVHARVIQPDGTVVENPQVYDGSQRGGGGQGTVYSSYNVLQVMLPQVRPGSIVDVQYTTESTAGGLYHDEFETSFFFGGVNPTLRFEYTVNLPESMDIRANQTRKDYAYEEEIENDRRILTWRQEDLPGVIIEPMMPPYGELVPSLKVTSFKDWNAVAKWFWRLSEQQMTLPDDIKEKAQELTKDAKTRDEKIKAIYRFIIDEIRYVSISFGEYGCKPHKCERTFRTRYGDCKDTAILFVAMLEEVGVEAKPVLVRTFDMGDDPSGLPGARIFNHAIAYVPAGEDGEPAYWLDGTTDYFPFGQVPSMDRQAQALIVDKDGGTMTHIDKATPDMNGSDNTILATLRPDGSGTLDLRQDLRGEYATGMRRSFEAPENFRTNVDRFTQARFPGSKFSDFKHGTTDPESPCFLSFRVDAPQLAQRQGNLLKIVPLVFPSGLSQRYGGMNDRKHDVMLGILMEDTVNYTAKLPAGATIKSLPKPLTIETDYADYVRTVEQDGDTVTVKQSIIFKARRLPAKDYDAFKTFCNQVTVAQQDAIVYTSPAPAVDADADDAEEVKSDDEATQAPDAAEEADTTDESDAEEESE